MNLLDVQLRTKFLELVPKQAFSQLIQPINESLLDLKSFQLGSIEVCSPVEALKKLCW